MLVVHKAISAIKTLLLQVCEQSTLYDLVADDQVRHQVWRIEAPGLIEEMTGLVEDANVLYIADGHHRSAAASRVAATQGAAPNAMANYFLAVAFPHDEMQILDYNRVVADLNGQQPDAFLKRIAETMAVAPSGQPVRPAAPRQFGMYLNDSWYRLRLDPAEVPDDPVASLDVSLLQHCVIEPLLGVGDPRLDPRIDFVGGIRGLDELERRVRQTAGGVAFSLFPTRMEDLMAVADAGAQMPPKSTWFEPKLADGLLTHVLD